MAMNVQYGRLRSSSLWDFKLNTRPRLACGFVPGLDSLLAANSCFLKFTGVIEPQSHGSRTRLLQHQLNI